MLLKTVAIIAMNYVTYTFALGMKDVVPNKRYDSFFKELTTSHARDCQIMCDLVREYNVLYFSKFTHRQNLTSLLV